VRAIETFEMWLWRSGYNFVLNSEVDIEGHTRIAHESPKGEPPLKEKTEIANKLHACCCNPEGQGHDLISNFPPHSPHFRRLQINCMLAVAILRVKVMT